MYLKKAKKIEIKEESAVIKYISNSNDEEKRINELINRSKI